METIAIGKMVTPILVAIFLCAAVCLAASCKFIGHGEVAFLPMVGIVVNVWVELKRNWNSFNSNFYRFYISTAIITLVASRMIWEDGFVGAGIFSVMSLLSASIMAAWSYHQTQNDTKPAVCTYVVDLSSKCVQIIRKRLSWILLIAYSVQGNGVQVKYLCW